MMTYQEFKSSGAVRSLLSSMGKVPPKLAASGDAFSWLEALEISSTYPDFRKCIIRLNDPNHGHWINAIKRRAGTCSTGEYWQLMGIAMLTDFGHVANQLTKANMKRRTGPWSGMYASLDGEHATALAACVYHSALA
jgi:hypothetical protein